MPRVIRVLPATTNEQGTPADTLILSFAQRQAARGIFASVKGARVEIDLAQPVSLRGGDCVELDDGTIAEIVAEPEPLLEARAADLPTLARLAWHLGDRHIPVEMLPNRLRVRKDAAVESLLLRLGARIAAIAAPFEPEGGAYAPGAAHRHRDDCHHDDNNHHHHHAHEQDHSHTATGVAARGHPVRRSER